MAYRSSYSSSRGSYRSSSSSRGSSHSYSSGGRSYSSARAHQHVGESFGGYTKVRTSSGDFRMRPTSKS
ncbi:hypothetical protein OFN97_05495 [Campylobacter sp. VBCF_05 NA6]|uniref:hypothetical protein n=1 Tax=unclassified Campylobacter TaxID=2593542 RepID=UPI001B57246B|nr:MULTISPECIES: hypothetical protein [unclassified Campylobacter]MBP3225067.1 hypothetical protein [Campylobacter sp.]MDA3057094.1 hypothetical protein [Campylobacter sp. VBCF_04 NA7]MDA3059468.1 hypothetical protein [Campylobacter sp. VBCF_05 NA6]